MRLISRLEESILIAIWILEDNAYGVRINQEVSKSLKKNYSLGSLYFTLDQLYKKGLVTKNSGNPTPERGGRRKTYYQITQQAKQELQAVKEHQQSLWEGVRDFAEDTK
jgi:DNA-binding PadR family transcriptional regulator